MVHILFNHIRGQILRILLRINTQKLTVIRRGLLGEFICCLVLFSRPDMLLFFNSSNTNSIITLIHSN